MKMLFSSFIFFCAMLGAESVSSQETYCLQEQLQIGSDFEEQWELARRKQEPVLLAFVAVSECPWSTKWYHETLSNPAFLQVLQDRISIVVVPISEEGSSWSSFQETAKRWKEKWQVKESPCAILVEGSGEEIYRSGFLPLGPQDYAAHFMENLHEYLALRQAIQNDKIHQCSDQELEELYKKARTLGFKKYKDEIFQIGKKRAKTPFFLLVEYEEVLSVSKRKDPKVLELRKKILEKDPKNTQGTHLKIAMIDFHENVKRMKQKEKPNHVLAPLLDYMEKFGEKDKENGWRIEMMVAQFLFTRNRLTHAIKHAKQSFKKAPEIVRSEIEQTVAYLEKYQSQCRS
jgi:protein disulfide-isomerase